MQLANVSLLAAITILAAGAANAQAPAANGLPAVPVTTANQPAGMPTATALSSIQIGKATNIRAGTLGELEQVQSLTALAEAKKKLAELQPKQEEKPKAEKAELPLHPTGAVGVKSGGAKGAASKGKLDQAPPTQPAPVAFIPPAPVVQYATAKVIRLVMIGGKARADLVDGGKALTVKEGDKLGEWEVASITSSGVFVEQTIQPAPSGGLVPLATGETQKRKAKLEPAGQADVASVSVSSSQPAQNFQAPIQAPVPVQMPSRVPDSVQPAVPPLPPNLGARPLSPTINPVGR